MSGYESEAAAHAEFYRRQASGEWPFDGAKPKNVHFCPECSHDMETSATDEWVCSRCNWAGRIFSCGPVNLTDHKALIERMEARHQGETQLGLLVQIRLDELRVLLALSRGSLESIPAPRPAQERQS